MGASFDGAGRLVTSSQDGWVRLYAEDQYAHPIKKFRLKDLRPWTAVFSPDGKRVAVSYADIPKVVVLSGSDLTKLFEADSSGITDGDFASVGWSQDGRFLFAGGKQQQDGSLIRRWSDGGKGAFTDIHTSSNTITVILGLKSGSTLFAGTTDFGLINADTSVQKLQGEGGVDLSSIGVRGLLASTNGTVVEVKALEPSHNYRFSLTERRVYTDPPPDASLLPPGQATIATGRLRAIIRTLSSIELDPNELMRSLDVVPGERKFVLGGDFSVRLFDQRGHELWRQAVPGSVWHVNVTRDGQLVVVAYGDGTIRWLRVSDGKELLAVFIHPDGKRWVAWTPNGYYDASVGGDELIGWHVNNGLDRAPDFFPAARFRDQYNRPDIVALVLKTLDVDKAVDQANAASGRTTAAAVTAETLPPVAKLNLAS